MFNDEIKLGMFSELYANADYLLTGDSRFFTDKVKSEIKVRNAREFLDEIEKA